MAWGWGFIEYIGNCAETGWNATVNTVNYVSEKKEVLKSILSEISVSVLKRLLDKGILVEIDKEVYRLVDTL